jgi:hypothetical protein
MRSVARAVLACLAVASLAACAHAPNPIVARDPIPPPPPGYRVACDTYTAPFYLYFGSCRPVRPPAAVVVRARG